MLTLFGKNTLPSFAALLQEVFWKGYFNGEDSENNLNFLKAGYLLGRLVPSFEDRNEEGCFNREPE